MTAMLVKALANMPAAFIGGLVGMRRNAIRPVLLYHANYSSPLGPLGHGNPHNVEPEILSAQIRFLKKHFEIVALEEIFAGHRSSKANMAAITFDDGYSSILTEALPILEELQVPFTVFITTGLVTNRRFWRDDVRWVINRGLVRDFLEYAIGCDSSFNLIEPTRFYRDTKAPSLVNSKLVADVLNSFLDNVHATESIRRWGEDIYCSKADLVKVASPLVSFGNHTVNHYVLSSLSQDEQSSEIAGADSFLRTLGKPRCSVFSIPFGGSNTFNSVTLDIIESLGYQGYLLSQNGTNHVRAKALQGSHSSLVAMDRLMPDNHMVSYLLRLLR